MERLRILYTQEEAKEQLSQYTDEQRQELDRLAEVFIESLGEDKPPEWTNQ